MNKKGIELMDPALPCRPCAASDSVFGWGGVDGAFTIVSSGGVFGPGTPPFACAEIGGADSGGFTAGAVLTGGSGGGDSAKAVHGGGCGGLTTGGGCGVGGGGGVGGLGGQSAARASDSSP